MQLLKVKAVLNFTTDKHAKEYFKRKKGFVQPENLFHDVSNSEYIICSYFSVYNSVQVFHEHLKT